jgi:hypothetical protein
VIGEQNTEDPAAFSRLLMIYMKAKRSSGASFEEINIKSDYFPSIIREILEENDFEELKKTFKDCLDASNKYCEKIK